LSLGKKEGGPSAPQSQLQGNCDLPPRIFLQRG
jgi:hypothetical protein